MRTAGGTQSERTLEADVDWSVADIDMDGTATVRLLIHNQKEEVSSSNASFARYIPYSEIAVTSDGRLIYGKILVDDSSRIRTRKIMDVVPGVRLLADKDFLNNYFERLWYSVDSTNIDTLGTPVVRSYDSTVLWSAEHDTSLYGRNEIYRSAYLISYKNRGKVTYTLQDTAVNNIHYWHLLATSDGESFFTVHYKNKYHYVQNILFRKDDGLIQAMRSTIETHNGAFMTTGETSLELTKMEWN